MKFQANGPNQLHGPSVGPSCTSKSVTQVPELYSKLSTVTWSLIIIRGVHRLHTGDAHMDLHSTGLPNDIAHNNGRIYVVDLERISCNNKLPGVLIQSCYLIQGHQQVPGPLWLKFLSQNWFPAVLTEVAVAQDAPSAPGGSPTFSRPLLSATFIW